MFEQNRESGLILPEGVVSPNQAATPTNISEYESKIEKSQREKHLLSFINSAEEEEAKRIIEEALGFPPPRMVGYYMAVKIYVRPSEISSITNDKGEKVSFYLPESVSSNDKYASCVALVVSQGPQCYKGTKFEEGPWCKVGDWIVIPRNEGTQINYRGVPMQFIPDDRMYAIVEDPTYVTKD